MQTFHGDASRRLLSLDVDYWFVAGLSRMFVALIQHSGPLGKTLKVYCIVFGLMLCFNFLLVCCYTCSVALRWFQNKIPLLCMGVEDIREGVISFLHKICFYVHVFKKIDCIVNSNKITAMNYIYFQNKIIKCINTLGIVHSQCVLLFKCPAVSCYRQVTWYTIPPTTGAILRSQASYTVETEEPGKGGSSLDINL